MPGLDLLAEDDGQAGGPGRVGADDGRDGGGEGAEELGGEGADVVEVDLEGVRGGRDAGGGRLGCGELQPVAGELGGQGHGGRGGCVGEAACEGGGDGGTRGSRGVVEG